MPTLAHSSLIDRSKKFPTHFYESASGNQPVREWILALSVEDRKLVGRDIQKVEFGWPLGMPYCRSRGNGLWEARSDLTGGKIRPGDLRRYRRAHGALAWLPQENAEDSHTGFTTRSQADEPKNGGSSPSSAAGPHVYAAAGSIAQSPIGRSAEQLRGTMKLGLPRCSGVSNCRV